MLLSLNDYIELIKNRFLEVAACKGSKGIYFGNNVFWQNSEAEYDYEIVNTLIEFLPLIFDAEAKFDSAAIDGIEIGERAEFENVIFNDIWFAITGNKEEFADIAEKVPGIRKARDRDDKRELKLLYILVKYIEINGIVISEPNTKKRLDNGKIISKDTIEFDRGILNKAIAEYKVKIENERALLKEEERRSEKQRKKAASEVKETKGKPLLPKTHKKDSERAAEYDKSRQVFNKDKKKSSLSKIEREYESESDDSRDFSRHLLSTPTVDSRKRKDGPDPKRKTPFGKAKMVGQSNRTTSVPVNVIRHGNDDTIHGALFDREETIPMSRHTNDDRFKSYDDFEEEGFLPQVPPYQSGRNQFPQGYYPYPQQFLPPQPPQRNYELELELELLRQRLLKSEREREESDDFYQRKMQHLSSEFEEQRREYQALMRQLQNKGKFSEEEARHEAEEQLERQRRFFNEEILKLEQKQEEAAREKSQEQQNLIKEIQRQQREIEFLKTQAKDDESSEATSLSAPMALKEDFKVKEFLEGQVRGYDEAVFLVKLPDVIKALNHPSAHIELYALFDQVYDKLTAKDPEYDNIFTLVKHDVEHYSHFINQFVLYHAQDDSIDELSSIFAFIKKFHDDELLNDAISACEERSDIDKVIIKYKDFFVDYFKTAKSKGVLPQAIALYNKINPDDREKFDSFFERKAKETFELFQGGRPSNREIDNRSPQSVVDFPPPTRRNSDIYFQESDKPLSAQEKAAASVLTTTAVSIVTFLAAGALAATGVGLVALLACAAASKGHDHSVQQDKLKQHEVEQAKLSEILVR